MAVRKRIHDDIEDTMDDIFRKREIYDDNFPVVEPMEEDEPSGDLTYKQELFCRCYAWMYTDTAGNWIRSYKRAYECNYDTAHSNAHRLMAKEGIKARIKELSSKVMTNEEADFELWYVIRQRSELSAKVSAYMAHAKVWGRIIDKSQFTLAPEMQEWYNRVVESNHKKAQEWK